MYIKNDIYRTFPIAKLPYQLTVAKKKHKLHLSDVETVKSETCCNETECASGVAEFKL